MSKHTNKHWLREKEYISLIKERDLIWDSLPRYRRLYSNNRSNSRLVYNVIFEDNYRDAPWYW
jgi:hypothetical protein